MPKRPMMSKLSRNDRVSWMWRAKSPAERWTSSPTYPRRFKSEYQDRPHGGDCNSDMAPSFHKKGAMGKPSQVIRSDSASIRRSPDGRSTRSHGGPHRRDQVQPRTASLAGRNSRGRAMGRRHSFRVSGRHPGCGHCVQRWLSVEGALRGLIGPRHLPMSDGRHEIVLRTGLSALRCLPGSPADPAFQLLRLA